MSVRTVLAATFALWLATPPALPQEAAKKLIPCDLATVDDEFWCAKCRKIRDKDQVDGEKCRECQSAVEKLKVCVKKWIPACGMHQQAPHLEPCCKSKMCCKFQTVKSPVVFRCEGCGQTAREEKDLKHDPKSHEQKVVKSCELSGMQPHGGDPIKQP